MPATAAKSRTRVKPIPLPQLPRSSALMPDLEETVNILSIRSEWIPERFLYFLLSVEPIVAKLTGFSPWPYQIKTFELLFQAWAERKDAALKQARQSGKSIPTAIWLAYMICIERCQVVVLSTKTQKTRKIARYLLRIMRASGEPMSPDSTTESRFDDEAGFVCFSGKPEAERESDSAHIVLIDEGQDVPIEPVYGDVSPMRSGFNGILVVMGIGGVVDSFVEHMFDNPQVLKMEIPYTEVAVDRPHYVQTVEKDRVMMTPTEFKAHYECQRIIDTGAVLLPYILPWNEHFPDTPFNPEAATELYIGVDWGRWQDSTALLAVAKIFDRSDPRAENRPLTVLYGYELMSGMGWFAQLDRCFEFVKRTMFDFLKPELNHVGDALVEFFEARMREEQENNNFEISDDGYQPVYSDEHVKSDANKRLCVISTSQQMYYVPDLTRPDASLHDRCVSNLRRVKMKFNIGGRLTTEHSDWMSALRCPFYPTSTAYRSQEAA